MLCNVNILTVHSSALSTDYLFSDGVFSTEFMVADVPSSFNISCNMAAAFFVL
jgi:hypothetical protein